MTDVFGDFLGSLLGVGDNLFVTPRGQMELALRQIKDAKNGAELADATKRFREAQKLWKLQEKQGR